jgi:MFS family permease
VTRAAGDQDAGAKPVRVNALLAVLALAGTVFAMMQALVIPALPRIQVSLGTNADGAAWISTAYLLSACILTPVIGRVIQGAAGGIYPLAFAIIRDRLPRERVPGSIGLVSSLLGIGGGLGLVLPGPIMTRLSYQWLFWLPLMAIAAALLLAARCIPADGPAEAGARVPWLSAVLIAVSESATWHWANIRTLSLLVLGAAALLAWGRLEAAATARWWT